MHSLQVLPTRLARSKALQQLNRVKIAVRDKEDELKAIQKAKGMDEAKEVRYCVEISDCLHWDLKNTVIASGEFAVGPSDKDR
jgi:hypothetical protein